MSYYYPSDWSNARVVEHWIAGWQLVIALAAETCMHCADQIVCALASSFALLPMLLGVLPHSKLHPYRLLYSLRLKLEQAMGQA